MLVAAMSCSLGVSMASVSRWRDGINANLLAPLGARSRLARHWGRQCPMPVPSDPASPLAAERQSTAFKCHVRSGARCRQRRRSDLLIELARGDVDVKVSWPSSAAGRVSAAWLRELLLMIRIDAVWLAVQPMDMRAGGRPAAGGASCSVFCAAPRRITAICSPARVATRIKLLVHDGFGIWCATRRLNVGRFSWMPATADAPASLSLTRPAVRRPGCGPALAASARDEPHHTGLRASCRFVDGASLDATRGAALARCRACWACVIFLLWICRTCPLPRRH
jgi:transposase